MRHAGGFTMIELLLTLTIALILLGIALPRFGETNSRVALASARSKVTVAVSAARAAATRFGRISTLVVDVAGDRLRVEVDTSALGGELPILLREVDLWSGLGVNLRASDPLICFDPRGISVASGACTGRAVVIRLERSGLQDSVVVSATGRVVP